MTMSVLSIAAAGGSALLRRIDAAAADLARAADQPETASSDGLPAVDPMRALMDLVALQRAFELNNKVIRAADDILAGINTLRRTT